MLKDFLGKIKANPTWKRWAHRMMIPKGDYKPRLWIRLMVNPWIHKKGKDAKIRLSVRKDLFPYNPFSLGSNSLVEDFSVLNNGVGPVAIGSNTIIGLSNVIIGPVMIGDNVMLAQHVVISGLNHGYEDIAIAPALQPVSTQCVTIEDDVWIGANSTIVAGVHVGKHSVVGAGSVVTKDIPPYTVAVGNPARAIKQWNRESNKWEKI